MKQVDEHHWSSVVKGDDRGVYELVGEEAERVKEIHNRLEHLTSEKMVSKLSIPLESSLECFSTKLTKGFGAFGAFIGNY